MTTARARRPRSRSGPPAPGPARLSPPLPRPVGPGTRLLRVDLARDPGGSARETESSRWLSLLAWPQTQRSPTPRAPKSTGNCREEPVHGVRGDLPAGAIETDQVEGVCSPG